MDREQDIDATYTHGVLRPDEPLQLPENARVRVTLHRSDTLNGAASGPTPVEPSPEEAKRARELWDNLARRGVIRLGGWHPTRDEMHDRD